MVKKICSKCKIEKHLCEFHKYTHSKDGFRTLCKECRKIEKIKNKLYREKNKEKLTLKRTIWFEENPNYIKQYQKKYNIENRKKLNEKLKKWREKNKEKILQEQRKTKKEKYDNDINFKLSHLLRCRINKIIKFKRNRSSIEILGCTIEEFKIYIEGKFKSEMSWENYGYYGWHIDHIIPLSSAGSNEGFIELCHYTNLQPLWKDENLNKSNKIL